MPQGAKKPSTPVSINQLSGTFKRGGSVTPAQSRLMKNFASENKTAMKQAKAQSNEVYSKYQKMADGGRTSSEGAISDRELKMMGQEKAKMEQESGILRKLRKQHPNLQIHDFFDRFPKAGDEMKGMGSVTETEKSITVSPAGKKRGGRAC
jgi:hypothetical protein